MQTVKHGTRDIHSAANMDPSKYTYRGWIYQGPSIDQFVLPMIAAGADAETIRAELDRICNKPLKQELRAEAKRPGGYRGNWINQGTCDHCGAHFHYGEVYTHANGQSIVVGHICAGNTMESGRDKADQDRHRAEKIVAGFRTRGKKAERFAANLEQHPGLAEAFETASDRDSEEANILRDLRAKLYNYSSLSEKQVSFAFRLARDLRDGTTRQERKEKAQQERAARMADVPAWTAGRVELSGVIVSAREHESEWGVSWKMLIEQEDGKRLWLTMPEVIGDEIIDRAYTAYRQAREELASDGGDPNELEEPGGLRELARGQSVSLRVTVKPSDDDPHFGFGSRPAKAALVLD